MLPFDELDTRRLTRLLVLPEYIERLNLSFLDGLCRLRVLLRPVSILRRWLQTPLQTYCHNAIRHSRQA